MIPRIAARATARCLRRQSALHPAVLSNNTSKAFQSRSYLSSRNPLRNTRQAPYQPRSYSTTNPNPPLGAKNAKNASGDRLARVALIGARGYTGKALIDLFNKHPHIDLKYVSSRELAGQKLKGYEKSDITYNNLSVENVRKIAERNEIDCWVMALPNGVCKPFVDAIEEVGDKDSVIVDLSADYRFDNKLWTYGLPELSKIMRTKTTAVKRVSNPGCYATAAQISIAPIVKLELLGGQPTIFGVSGYSGAGKCLYLL